MAGTEVNAKLFQELLQNKAHEISKEPEYGWRRDFCTFMQDGSGKPAVRVGIVNFSPDQDMWEGLRTPALIGRYPLTPADIWDHYAAANFQRVRSDGRASPLAMPETYEQARERIGRVIVVSAMLAVNPVIYEEYAKKIDQGDKDPFDYYKRATLEVAEIIDKAVSKFSLSLMAPERAVVPMTLKSTLKIIERTRGEYRKGSYHGPCNNLWPQNSVAVLTGLLQFGVHRLPFRDEVGGNGHPRRLYGRYRSIVIFDELAPVSDPDKGVTLLDQERFSRLHRLNDYTDVEAETTDGRYCTYNMTNDDGKSVCGKCIESCPSNALGNSSPEPDGKYSERIERQKHRFSDEKLAFDYRNCRSDREQKSELFEDYVCARCEAICAAQGIRKQVGEIDSINKGDL